MCGDDETSTLTKRSQSRPRYPISKRKAFVSTARRIHSITRIYLTIKWSNTEKISPFETLGPCGLDAFFFFVRFLMRNVRNISFGYVVLERCVYAFYTLHYHLLTNTTTASVSLTQMFGYAVFPSEWYLYVVGCRALSVSPIPCLSLAWACVSGRYITHLFVDSPLYLFSLCVCVCGIMDVAEHTLSTRTTR